MEPREVTIGVRLSQKEYDAFCKAADEAGLTLSAWIRMHLRKKV
jgi:hypothetical protein